MSATIFRDAVKEGTFLHHYLDYMNPIETPVAYDFWCGLWLISTAIGRRMHVARPKAPVYLNLYLILCAEAGTTRKSTAIRMCEAVYRAAGLDKENITITSSVTPEKFRELLALRSNIKGSVNASLIVSELVTLLGKELYTMAMPGLLTDLYDCPELRDYARIGSTGTVKNIYLTFLSASTPSWLVRAINPDVIEGGFTSRCLFIIEEKRKRMVAWPEEESNVTPDMLGERLQYLQKQAERWKDQNIMLTESAKKRFVTWYERRTTTSHDPFTTSFDAREDHHVLRLAALLAANEDAWMINAHHITHAIKIVAHHKHTGALMFGANRESARITAGLDKLRNVLMTAGEMGLSQSEVLFKTRNWLRTRELEYALTIMHELDMVQRFDMGTRGRRKTLWRATNKILARTLNQLVMEKMEEG